MRKKLFAAAVVAAVVAGVAVPAAAPEPVPSAAELRDRNPAGCERTFTQARLAGFARPVYHTRERISKKAHHRVFTMRTCQRSRKAQRNGLRLVRRLRAWRKKVGVWKIRWNNMPSADQTWGRRVAWCESDNDPRAVSPHGDLGLMQFKQGTWISAGGAGDPRDASRWEQLVRAIWWRDIEGADQWPTCGV